MSNRVHLYPHTAERDYQRVLLKYVRDIHTELNKRLESTQILRVDAWSDDLTQLIEGLLIFASNPLVMPVAKLPESFLAVNRFNDKQWILQVKAGTGISIPPSGQIPRGMIPYGSVSEPGVIRARFGIGVDVYRSEPWMISVRDNWIAENTRLIKTIPQQYLGDVEGVIRRGVSQGLSPKAMAEQLQERFGVAKSRAQLIAVDQIGKANSQLTEYRQKDLGITEYIWESSDDSRVRPAHKAADGKKYSWDKPPAATGGHPGYTYRCRCWARSVWPDGE